MINKITKQQSEEYLERFNGTPGETQGLSQDESLELFQYLIDSEEIYSSKDEGLRAFVQIYSEEEYLTGLDLERFNVR